MADDDGVGLTDKAARAVDRGGDDDMTDDQLLLAEIVKRAPGLSPEELKQCFIAIGMEYGADALRAIREGAVQFEPRKPQ